MVAALALRAREGHPAVRRRIGVPAAIGAHDVALRPFGGGGGAAMIVTAAEADFIPAVLDDLVAPDAAARIAARRGRRRGSDGVLELHLPLHRRFHLLLLEAYCRTPGSPRLDPRKLEGMGLVLRRFAGRSLAAWMQDGAARKGWLPVHGGELDPDPLLRPQPRSPASRQIATLIATRRGERPFAEEVLPLFAAPPEVCAKAGRTLLYGLVQVASAEESGVAPPAPDYAALPADEVAALTGHLSSYLKPRAGTVMSRAREKLEPDWKPLDPPPLGGAEDSRLNAFAIFLQQLLVELGAFDDDAVPRALVAALDTIDLPMAVNAEGRIIETMKAGAFVAQAARILVLREPNGSGLRMPLAWPEIDETLGTRLTTRAIACLQRRFAALIPPTPKFDDPRATYIVRGFIRVRGHDGCPPRLVWSDASERFRILPWWESEGPAAKIPLPGIADVKKLKPNVAFQVPPEIANLLQGDAKKLAEGEGSPDGLDIAWLCSFSLPAITLCAFIVLSIFLALLNIIFGWLAFIKICIPIPKPR
jgi:hypothetical protein